MEPEQEYAEIRAMLRAMTERQNQADIRFDQRMAKAERRMDRADQRMDRADKRMERFDQRMAAAEVRATAADARMDKFEKQLQRTRTLVEAGMKIVAGLAKSHRDLERSQKAFLDSLRRGGGNGRHHA